MKMTIEQVNKVIEEKMCSETSLDEWLAQHDETMDTYGEFAGSLAASAIPSIAMHSAVVGPARALGAGLVTAILIGFELGLRIHDTITAEPVQGEGWVKLPCHCYAEWSPERERWEISASAFTCDHSQGDVTDGAPPA